MLGDDTVSKNTPPEDKADTSSLNAPEATASQSDANPDAAPTDAPAAEPDKAEAAAQIEEPLPEEPPSDTQGRSETPLPVPVLEQPKKGNSFLPLVLGGIVAGGIGFLAAQQDLFGPAEEDPSIALRGELSAQQERIAALEDTPAPDLTPLETQLEAVQTSLGEIESRISELEARPVVSLPEGDATEAAIAAAAATYATELEALRESVVSQRSEIEELINNARSVEEATAEAAKTANAQAALAKIVSAIDAGQPFAEPVETLGGLELGEIDPALNAAAEEGVPTLSALQAEFPAQARQALAAARSAAAGDGQQGIGGFLTRSLGARSVTPREGDDPDAVLSRAEAAVQSGDLVTTLNELDALPEEAQAAIADWRAGAEARVAARKAADALAQRLTAD